MQCLRWAAMQWRQLNNRSTTITLLGRQDKATYTTVTAHWIDDKTWMRKSAVLDFKIFEGLTTGKRIYEDVMAVLKKYQGETEDTIVFNTIGITDTAGNMGKLGKYLRDNGKEHGYCTDHNLHLVARLAFDREIS
jgi:hypothetical protein